MTVYLIKTVLCAFAFYAFYRFVLEKESMYRFNRAYLLSALSLSLVIPAMVLPAGAFTASITVGEPQQMIIGQGYPVGADAAARIDLLHIITGIYLFVSAVLLLRFVRGLASILIKVRKGGKIPSGRNTIVLVEDRVLPHSFFGYIFLNREDYESGRIGRQVIMHESAHAAHRHSLDKIFIELLICLMWFNPALYLYRRAIDLNHEYFADNSVLSAGADLAGYQNLLLRRLSGCGNYMFTNPFSFLITKKRLLMMTKTTTKRTSLLKAVFILPLTALCIFVFSCKSEKNVEVQEEKAQHELTFTEDVPAPESQEEKAQHEIVNTEVVNTSEVQQKEKIQPDIVYIEVANTSETQQKEKAQPDIVYIDTNTSETRQEDEPFIIVQEMPQFQSKGLAHFRTYVMTRLVYPKEAIEKGIQGKVLVSFIIEKDGKLSSVEIVDSPNKLLSDEVVRVLGESPDWTPGRQRGEAVRVKFTMPIDFNIAN